MSDTSGGKTIVTFVLGSIGVAIVLILSIAGVVPWWVTGIAIAAAAVAVALNWD